MFDFNKVSFDEANKYFKNKIPVNSKEFYKLSQRYMQLAFTVSNYTKVQVVKAFYDKVLSAIENGTTIDEFKNTMDTILTDNGYKGMTPFQAENIFRTNIQTAYNVGHFEQMQEPTVKSLRPYWQYDAVEDSHTRPSHLAMNGKVFHCDSPIWDIWYPPNGFKCRCGVDSLSEFEVESLGLTVEEELPRGMQLPSGQYVHIMPDQNFATNPAKAPFSPDLEGYPESLKTAYAKTKKQE